VYLWLHGYRQHSVQRKSNQKLSPKFYEPYRIFKKIRPVAYQLAFSPKAKIHDSFHIFVHKKWVGVGVSVQDHLPLVVDDSRVTPQAVPERRTQQGIPEVLVHWKGSLPPMLHGNLFQTSNCVFLLLPLRARAILRGNECCIPILPLMVDVAFY
jgi:hypothetical protein